MDSTNERDRALDKVKKLLAIAKDGRGNINEAEAALRQAHALMRKWQIDEAEAIQREIQRVDEAMMAAFVKTGGTATRTNNNKGGAPNWASWLAVSVAKMYDCKAAITEDSTRGKLYTFYGYRHDVPVACWTFEYLAACIARGGRAFDSNLRDRDSRLDQWGLNEFERQRLINLSPKARMQSFREGTAIELGRRIKALIAERKGLAIKAENALVVVKDEALRKAYPWLFDPKNVTKVKESRMQVTEAWRAGALQARRTNIETTAVEHDKENQPKQLS